MPFLPILLSDGFIPTVKQADHVIVGQVIAKKAVAQEAAINLATELGVPPRHVGKYLKKNPGDSMQPGDIIAIQKGFLGSTKEKVVSVANGVVTRYDRENGIVYIHVAGEESVSEQVLNSPIEGIVSLCNNDKILIETEKDVVQGSKGAGGQNTETVLLLAQSETVFSYHLDAGAIGKIVLGQYFPKDILIKAVSMGVKGVIGTKILDIDMVYLQGRNTTVPIIEVATDDYKKLTHCEGKKAFLSGKEKTIILLHS